MEMSWDFALVCPCQEAGAWASPKQGIKNDEMKNDILQRFSPIKKIMEWKRNNSDS
jgi:hypothetical protein